MARRGLGGSPLEARGKSARKSTSVVAAVRQAAETEIRYLPLDEVADNPENSPARLEDVAELAASLQQVGQLQPGLVVAAEDFLADYPQHAKAIGDRRWVLLAGHRRRAAAAQAGLGTLAVIERSTERLDEAVLHENMHRKALTPIEEAQAFARVMERQDLSQRKMAEHAGVSQSHIAKRLQLLSLPEELQVAVARDDLSPGVAAALPSEVDDAEVLARIGTLWAEDERDDTGSVRLKRLTLIAQREHEKARRLARAQDVAAQEGVEVIEDPSARFQGLVSRHELHTPEEIAAARESGDLAYAPAARWSADDEPMPVRLSTPSREILPHEKEAKEQDRQQRTAATARMAFLESTVKRKPGSAEVQSFLVALTLHGCSLQSHVTEKARKLAQSAGVGPSEPDSGWAWRDSIVDVSKSATREHLAWIIALAILEDRAKNSHTHQWDALDLTYFDYLISRGYEPTAWEQDLITQARQHATKQEQS